MAWPDDRAVDYDADKGWDEENEAWSSEAEFTNLWGGRHKQQAIFVADGTIYFEDY